MTERQTITETQLVCTNWYDGYSYAGEKHAVSALFKIIICLQINNHWCCQNRVYAEQPPSQL